MSMLGLGDIVVPALVLAVALRFDYVCARGLSGGGGAVRSGGASTPRSAAAVAGSYTAAVDGVAGGGGGEEEGGDVGHDLAPLLGTAVVVSQEGALAVDAATELTLVESAAVTAVPLSLRAASAQQGADAAGIARRRVVLGPTLSSGGSSRGTLPPASDALSSASSLRSRVLAWLTKAGVPFPPGGGAPYWAIAVVGYGVGLAAANIAVSVSHMGQPALLYLVPATLIPLFTLAWARGELDAIYRGREVELGGRGDASGGHARSSDAHEAVAGDDAMMQGDALSIERG